MLEVVLKFFNKEQLKILFESKTQTIVVLHKFMKHSFFYNCYWFSVYKIYLNLLFTFFYSNQFFFPNWTRWLYSSALRWIFHTNYKSIVLTKIIFYFLVIRYITDQPCPYHKIYSRFQRPSQFKVYLSVQLENMRLASENNGTTVFQPFS